MPLIDLNGLAHFKEKENSMIASEYVATKAYKIGEYAYYNGTLMRCKVNMEQGEAWTAGHWTAAKMGDDVSDLKNAYDDIKTGETFRVEWGNSSSYPTGWRSGYYTGNVGDTYGIASSNTYMRASRIVGANVYPQLKNSKKMIITPPTGCSARVIEYNAENNIITRTFGQINTNTYPEYIDVPVIVDNVKPQTHNYLVAVGRFGDNSAGTKASDPTYVETIKFEFYKEGFKRKTGTYEFFSVDVERPLPFGDEAVNAIVDTVEAVLRLPDGYAVGGDPVPLVLMCHGASGYIDAANEKWYNSSWKAFCDTMLEAGFALFDVNVLPTSLGTSVCGYCMGSPLAVNVAKRAYDYIIANYNVQHKILVHGTSMGGTLANAFTKAYPHLCLAQSSFAGRDVTQYLRKLKDGGYDSDNNFALVYGYESIASLKSDAFSHVEGVSPSLSIKKYTSGVVALPPDRSSSFNSWLEYYAEIQNHERTDTTSDYSAYRPVPYKSWNSWADDEACTKAELILQKAYVAGGSAPYYCVVYDDVTHTELSYGQVNDMILQLIAWYRRWL